MVILVVIVVLLLILLILIGWLVLIIDVSMLDSVLRFLGRLLCFIYGFCEDLLCMNRKGIEV